MPVRAYPRPFVRAQSPVRCRSAGGHTLQGRIRTLARSHRTALRIAASLSLLAHGSLWLLGPSPDTFRPDPILGYEGPTRILAIRVIDTETAQEALAEERRRSGAMVAAEIRTDQVREARAPRDPFETTENEPTRRTETQYYVIEAPPSVTEPEPEEPIRFELREDLSVESSTFAAARSVDIRLIWVVRPDYPRYARQNGIEGLVRLEAEVGITGKVLDVHVLDAPDGGLALAASRSLLLWEFQPLRVGGQLRKFRVIVPFRFTLVG